MLHPTINSVAYTVANKAMVITGTGRSGTTVIGKLFNSFDSVEYIFEPPTLLSLFAVQDKIDCNSWRLLYETFICEEFLMNCLAGRNINRNCNDDSCIQTVKSEAEIESRLCKSYRKLELVDKALSSTVVYKLLNLNSHIEQLKMDYPQTKSIFVTRNASDVMVSIQKKSWFSEASLESGLLFWPFYIYKNCKIPSFVKKDDFDKWLSFDEINKCAYYYVVSHDLINVNDVVIKYEEFVDNVNGFVEKLCARLGVRPGSKTSYICSEVYKRKNNANDGILGDVCGELRVRIQEINSFTSSI